MGGALYIIGYVDLHERVWDTVALVPSGSLSEL